MSQTSATEHLLRHDRVILIAVMVLLFCLAALYTVFGIGMNMTALDMTAMRNMRDMPGPRAPGDWSAGYAVLVFLMWWAMMIAMMLPSVLPTVLLNAALLRHAGHSGHVSGQSVCFLAGYLAVWAGFSLLATGAQWGLEAAGIVSATMMVLIDSLPGGILLILTGLYQLTPMKRACLTQCRSPIKFLSERRRAGGSGAFAMGAEHGAFCLGCCWVLMALLFFGGIMNLYWIVALTVFVALEKLTPWGERLAQIAGVGLLLAGAVVTANAL